MTTAVAGPAWSLGTEEVGSWWDACPCLLDIGLRGLGAGLQGPLSLGYSPNSLPGGLSPPPLARPGPAPHSPELAHTGKQLGPHR